MILAEVVHDALDNAMLNGWEEILEWPDEDIAIDLVSYESQLESQDPNTLLEHIRSWRKTLSQ